MEYADTLDYLFSQLPMYQRSGGAAYKADLSNTLALCDVIDNVQQDLSYVHIAGTNGKGSVAHMITSVLMEAGLKTGLYTSPHYKDFRERIKIDGQMIPFDAVTEFVDSYKAKWEGIQPSFFEITVAMAFWYFAKESVDIVVLETGMGGRLDSTNVITPEVSVITNIGLDHQQFLGETIEKIAYEKGGIVKPGVPLVLGEMNYKAELVLTKIASERQAPITKSSAMGSNLPKTDLEGAYQMENRATAVAALHQLQHSGLDITHEHMSKGLANVRQNTRFIGRYQVLGESPMILADSAHNEDGMKQLLAQLEHVDKAGLHVVLGVVGDKSADAVLKLLPSEAHYYFCKADIPRAMEAEDLMRYASTFGLKGEAFVSVPRAFEAARLYAQKSETILVTGSTFVVAEVI